MSLQGGAHEIGDSYPGNGEGVLKREEQAGPRPFVGSHVLQVRAVEKYLPFGNFIRRVTHERVGQGRLPGAVGTHDGVCFAGIDSQRNAGDDLLALHLNVYILKFKQCFFICHFQIPLYLFSFFKIHPDSLFSTLVVLRINL